MAVFRVAKTRDYTVMSNHHLKDKGLSLKAKGLLSVMLSLPDDWDYTLKGLSVINREGIDAIREAVRELEKAGYIVRARSRNEKGQLKGNEYVIFETPQPVPDSPTQEKPTLENPTLENPTQGFPTQDEPTQENPTQLNTIRQSKTYIPKTQKSNPYQSKRAEGADGCDEMGSVASEHDIRLKKHILEYIKTRDVYVAYRKAGYSKQFLAEHETEILLHKAAKKAFDELGVKKLPTIKQLQTEHLMLVAEKKDDYAEYRAARDEMRELLTVKANVDRILQVEESPKDRQQQTPTV